MSALTDAIAAASGESAITALITAAYRDNMAYEEDGSVANAKAFVTACRAILQRGMTVLVIGEERLEFNPTITRELIQDAQRYIAANAGPASGGGGVRHADFSSFRS